MRDAWHRHELRRYRRIHARINRVLALSVLLGSSLAASPMLMDTATSADTNRVITSLSSTSDGTYDRDRMDLLAQAQAYNLRLGGAGAHVDNAGLKGGNGGKADILSLSGIAAATTVLPYEDQLADSEASLLCWLEIPAIGVRQIVYHSTEEEALSMGAGHIPWSSLPVGGTSSHCVIAAHSGMGGSRMFDDLGKLETGDLFVLHTLGDAYCYRVIRKQTVTPEQAGRRCGIESGRDLCTLMTCTPYGINTHRLLVCGERCAYLPEDRQTVRYRHLDPTDRRSLPVLLLVGGLVLPASARAAIRMMHARRRKDAAPRQPPSGAAGALTARGGRRRRRRSRRSRLVASLGILSLVCGLATMAWQAIVSNSYRSLAERVEVVRDPQGRAPADGASSDAAIDWDVLREVNDEVAAWVCIEGTDIDLPVVSSSASDPTHYLHYDFWGRWSLEGTPFLDHRSEADGIHRLVFGHHLSSGGQFSMLRTCHEQASFETLGTCHWHTPRRGSMSLLPLCALRVDLWYEPIQTFDFARKEDVEQWLLELCAHASAKAPDCERLARQSRSVVTLATCSSEYGNQRWRTLVVFAGP